MSTRNIRKMREKLKKNDDSDVSLEDFEPGFTTKMQSGFGGLLVNSDSENEDTHADKPSGNSSSEHEAVVAKTGKQKKRKKNKHKKNKQNIGVDVSQSQKMEYDEIDQVVAEVNMLLGEPEQAASNDISEDKKETYNPLRVIAKHINVEYELLRLFGPNEDEERRNRRQRPRVLRRVIVQPNDEFVFTVKGLKMSLITIFDGVKYFKFEHSHEYVKNMKSTMKILEKKYNTVELHEPHVFTTDTIEAVLENNDIFYAMEALGVGRPSIEEMIFFLQGTFHPKFSFIDENVRLEYKYVENRMFHVGLLKYIHLLTNKACHRTALEIAKFLLNLDPSDPLAVILIIDTLALRAREHQWFVELYKHWEHERGAKHLFHSRFSYAMSLFHVATKNHDEDKIYEADTELQNAMLEFPLTVVKILDCSSQKNEDVSNSELFQKANNTTSAEMKALIFLYAKFTWPRWREPNVWKWFTKNASAIAHSYKDDATIQVRGDEFANIRAQLFRTYPLEIKRHLNTITPMSQLLVDGAVPSVERSVSHNPYPNQGETIDTNEYYKSWGASTAMDSLLRIFLRSMAPEPYRGG